MDNERVQRAQASHRVPLDIERYPGRRNHWLFFVVGLLLGVTIGVALALYR